MSNTNKVNMEKRPSGKKGFTKPAKFHQCLRIKQKILFCVNSKEELSLREMKLLILHKTEYFFNQLPVSGI